MSHLHKYTRALVIFALLILVSAVVQVVFDPNVYVHADITTGLVGHWTFDEGAGTTAADSSGNGNTGTLTNEPTWVAGQVGDGALSFDGTNDFLKIPSSAIYDFEGDFTVSAWVYIPVGGAQSFKGIVKRSTNSLSQLWGFEPITATRTDFVITNSAGTFRSQGTTFTQGAWTHLTGTLQGTTMKMYVNGAAMTPTTISGSFTTLAGTQIAVGSATGAGLDFLNGSVDEVRIYNRALSATEVTELYNYASEPPTPTPTASSSFLKPIGDGITAFIFSSRTGSSPTTTLKPTVASITDFLFPFDTNPHTNADSNPQSDAHAHADPP